MCTGTWESLAFRLGSVAEKTVYTNTKLPTISAASPVPMLYSSETPLAPPPCFSKWAFWNALTIPTPLIAPKHWATMYITARTSDTFRPNRSPNVTAGFMWPPAQSPRLTVSKTIVDNKIHARIHQNIIKILGSIN